MAKFEKGNKLGGRKPGSVNKVNAKVKRSIEQIVQENMDQLRQDLKDLKPKDRALVLVKLMEFILPKNLKVEAEVGNTYRMIWGQDPPPLDIDHKEIKE